MRKLWIITIVFSFMMAGCGANPGGFIDDVSTAEGTIMTAEATTAESIIATTVKTATTTNSVRHLQEAQPTTTGMTEATTTKMEDKTIDLNIETKRGDGTLTFTGVKFSYNKYARMNEVEFLYQTSEQKAKYPKTKETYLLDKNGVKYIAAGMGGVGNTGSIIFYEIPTEKDLSTVTLTYAFEGYDPVTVTFDIPGL